MKANKALLSDKFSVVLQICHRARWCMCIHRKSSIVSTIGTCLFVGEVVSDLL